jgi:hypothetical protein
MKLEETMNKNIGRRTGVLFVMLMIVYVLIASTPVSAYSYSGYKWLGTSTSYTWGSSIPSDWKSLVNDAANAWNTAGSKFRFSESSWTLNKIYKTKLGTAGPIAQATTWSLLKIIYLAKIDFNSDYTWSTSGQSGSYDVQNIATHELGHWLQLNDLYGGSDSEKTMYGYASKGETKKRSLETDDKNGIKYIYGT